MLVSIKLVIAEQIKSVGWLCLYLLVKYSICGFVELEQFVHHLTQLSPFLSFHSHDDGKPLLSSVSGRNLAGLFTMFAGPCTGIPASKPHPLTELSILLCWKVIIINLDPRRSQKAAETTEGKWCPDQGTIPPSFWPIYPSGPGFLL